MKEQNIPGVGKRYSMTSSDGSRADIIMRYNGKRDIYITDADEENEASISLSSDEAKNFALTLMDVDNNAIDEDEFNRFNVIQKKMLVDWIKVSSESNLKETPVGLAEQYVPDGVQIVGINRGDEIIAKPPHDFLIHEQDILLVIGHYESINAFDAACKFNKG